MSAEEHLIKAKRALQKANENGKTQASGVPFCVLYDLQWVGDIS